MLEINLMKPGNETLVFTYSFSSQEVKAANTPLRLNEEIINILRSENYITCRHVGIFQKQYKVYCYHDYLFFVVDNNLYATYDFGGSVDCKLALLNNVFGNFIFNFDDFTFKLNPLENVHTDNQSIEKLSKTLEKDIKGKKATLDFEREIIEVFPLIKSISIDKINFFIDINKVETFIESFYEKTLCSSFQICSLLSNPIEDRDVFITRLFNYRISTGFGKTFYLSYKSLSGRIYCFYLPTALKGNSKSLREKMNKVFTRYNDYNYYSTDDMIVDSDGDIRVEDSVTIDSDGNFCEYEDYFTLKDGSPVNEENLGVSQADFFSSNAVDSGELFYHCDNGLEYITLLNFEDRTHETIFITEYINKFLKVPLTSSFHKLFKEYMLLLLISICEIKADIAIKCINNVFDFLKETKNIKEVKKC